MFEKETLQNIYMLFLQVFSSKLIHEHFCTFEQFIGKTLIEIEYAAAKQTKATNFYHRQKDT